MPDMAEQKRFFNLTAFPKIFVYDSMDKNLSSESVNSTPNGKNHYVGIKNVKRYVNGKEVSEQDLKSIVLSHPLIDTIIETVNERLSQRNTAAEKLQEHLRQGALATKTS